MDRRRASRQLIATWLTATLAAASTSLIVERALAQDQAAPAKKECPDVIDPIIGGFEGLVQQADDFLDNKEVQAALKTFRAAQDKYVASQGRAATAQERLAAAQTKAAATTAAAQQAQTNATTAQAAADAARAAADAAAKGGGSVAPGVFSGYQTAAAAAKQAQAASNTANAAANSAQQSLQTAQARVASADAAVKQDADVLRKAQDAYEAALNKAKAAGGGGQEKVLEGGTGLRPQSCPPPGLYVSLQTQENFGLVQTREFLRSTGARTFESEDKGDPLGAGVVVGYNFRPWSNNVLIGPFASFDFLKQTINHNFGGGSFFGTTTHWIATAGVKAGIVTAPGLIVYGLGGVAVLNEDLNINFGGPVTSQNTTIPGATVGVGGEFQPRVLQQFGRPVALFVQYQHTWWQTAQLNAPVASPLFNYTFRREDDTFKAGVTVYFGGSPSPPPAPARRLITK